MAVFEIDNGNQIAEGGIGGFVINGNKIILAKYKGKYYAIDALCPHMGGDLSKGSLEGRNVICPRHGHKIDIFTGTSTGLHLPFQKPHTGKSRSYRVFTEGDRIKIEMP
jgi:3-phenylpropionate/trans-cinnamate dioxygenase ferredoxin component